MSQNLASVLFTEEKLAEIDAALDAVEAATADLINLSTEQRSKLLKMGPKSQNFCRTAHDVLLQNLNVAPPSFDVDEYKADMVAHDAWRTRMLRLSRLHERGSDTLMALGSDLMVASLDVYALMRVAGQDEGVDQIRQSMGERFRQRRSRPDDGNGDGPAETQ